MYRTVDAPPDEIVLVTQRAGFLARLAAALRAARGALALGLVFGLLFPGIIVAAVLRASSSSSWLGWSLAATAGCALVIGAPALVIAVIRSLPSHGPTLLPRSLRLAEGFIEVTPHDGPTYQARWPWFVGARARGGAIVLVVGREPTTELTIPAGLLDARRDQLLRRWLTTHELLRS